MKAKKRALTFTDHFHLQSTSIWPINWKRRLSQYSPRTDSKKSSSPIREMPWRKRGPQRILSHRSPSPFRHGTWTTGGKSYDVDVMLQDTHPDDYDALLLPGGVLNPDQLRMNDEAVDFVASFVELGKPVAAICHGPWMLAEAGVVDGRRMTSYASIRTDLRNAGANVVNEEAVTDDNLVTSRNPDDLPAFNDAMITLFSTATREAEAVAS